MPDRRTCLPPPVPMLSPCGNSSSRQRRLPMKDRQAAHKLHFAFSALRFLCGSSCRKKSRRASLFRECWARSFMPPGPGAVREIGGKTSLGRKMPGTWRFNSPPNPGPYKAYIAFPSTFVSNSGGCAESMIDVCRTPCSLRFQLSRRRFDSRGADCGMRRLRHAIHGAARPRWVVWRTAVLSRGEKDGPAGTHRRGSQLRGRMALPVARRHPAGISRSEEHTSELQSQSNLVCRLLLEKKKTPSTDDVWLAQDPDGREGVNADLGADDGDARRTSATEFDVAGLQENTHVMQPQCDERCP